MNKHGGKRINAGRPKGGGQYGEATTPMRVPKSRIEDIKRFLQTQSFKIPLYGSSVQAGFPSPADDYIESHLDLNEYLVQHPASTFMVRAEGDSMIGAGIYSGDILVVDRSIEPSNDKIVIAALEGELTVKRLACKQGRVLLVAENPSYPPIEVTDTDTIIWGVVTNVIHKV